MTESLANIINVINKEKYYGNFDKISEAFDKMAEQTDALETDMDLFIEEEGEEDDYFEKS